ncbi:hypothetical protein ACG7TL_005319 [Trametes sanguinea]
MKSSIVTLVLAAAAISAMSVVPQDATSIIEGINGITQLSIDTSNDVAKLSVSTAPAISPVIVTDLGEIDSAFNSAIGKILLSGPVVGEEAKQVVAALQDAVTQQQAVLAGLGPKATLAGEDFVTEISARLSLLRGDVNTLLTSLLVTVPTESATTTLQLDGLSGSYDQVINIYENE